MMTPVPALLAVCVSLQPSGAAPGAEAPKPPPAATPAAPSTPPPPAPAPAPAPAPPPVEEFIPTFSMFKHPLPMVMRKPIGTVQGRLDHAAFDPVSKKIFIAARSAGRLEVLDFSPTNPPLSIEGFSEPSGMVFVPSLRVLGVACSDGAVRLFKLDPSGNLQGHIDAKFDGSADTLRYDPVDGQLWVTHGSFLSAIDPETGKKTGPLELPGKGESMAIETSGPRLFINVPSPEPTVVVVDRRKLEIVTRWPLKDVKGNHPMALDEQNARLFTVARDPAKLVVLDTASGNAVATLSAPQDADDAWWDPVAKILYITGGGNGGRIHMVSQTDPNTYTLRHEEGTATGARTSVFIPERRSLAVFAPALGEGFGGNPALMFLYVLPP
jgi:hypothetical protein